MIETLLTLAGLAGVGSFIGWQFANAADSSWRRGRS